MRTSMNVYAKGPFSSTNLDDFDVLWEFHVNVTSTYSQEDISSFVQMYNYIDDERARELLKNIVGEKCLKSISKMVDVRELVALLKWLSKVLKLKVIDIDIIYEIEESVPQFVGIFVKDCNWEEWGTISKIVKSELVREGFKDFARRIVIVCSDALGA